MDLNLLTSLDVLLREQSVSEAARRLHLSAPAMSRTLTRAREAFGDALLVRAGRRLVLTPRALELRAEISRIVQDAEQLIRADNPTKLRDVQRTLNIRAIDSLAGVFAEPLSKAVRSQAPGLHLCFLPVGNKDVGELREGLVDLDLGVIGAAGPEIKVQQLFVDEFVGVARKDHPLLDGKMSIKRFTGQQHVGVSRRGQRWGPLDDILHRAGHARRNIVLIVNGYYAALVAVASSDLIGTVPLHFADHMARFLDLVVFTLPVRSAPLTVSQAWHPRLDADPVHRWLRQCVKETCVPPPAEGQEVNNGHSLMLPSSCSHARAAKPTRSCPSKAGRCGFDQLAE